jgi:hypothetical protein
VEHPTALTAKANRESSSSRGALKLGTFTFGTLELGEFFAYLSTHVGCLLAPGERDLTIFYLISLCQESLLVNVALNINTGHSFRDGVLLGIYWNSTMHHREKS